MNVKLDRAIVQIPDGKPCGDFPYRPGSPGLAFTTNHVVTGAKFSTKSPTLLQIQPKIGYLRSLIGTCVSSVAESAKNAPGRTIPPKTVSKAVKPQKSLEPKTGTLEPDSICQISEREGTTQLGGTQNDRQNRTEKAVFTSRSVIASSRSGPKCIEAASPVYAPETIVSLPSGAKPDAGLLGRQLPGIPANSVQSSPLFLRSDELLAKEVAFTEELND